MPLTTTDSFDALVDVLRYCRVVALTGAGCSTESGIPDYRGPVTRQKARNPIQFSEYLRRAEARRRYWARSAIGWPRFRDTSPNDGHQALAALEESGVLRGIITQNVDRLHHAAGSRRVVELHGALAEVRCLDCGHLEERDAVQRRIEEANPGWCDRGVELAPDGDAELSAERAADFQVPVCIRCAGTLKPGVVFFGENVPKPVVESAWLLMEEAEALLVIGSSLTVYSGFRFVKAAEKKRMPVAIVNLGETRGDPYAWVRVDARCGEVLPKLAGALIS